MQPSDSQTPILTSDRDCPVCGEPVHWSRFMFRAWVWAKWKCKKCNSSLGFSRKRRLILVIPVAIAGGIFGFLSSRYGFLIAFPIYLLGVSAIFSLDHVTVVGNRNNRYCPLCRYDLSGNIAAGILKCPECGRDVSANHDLAGPPFANQADGDQVA
jgi:ribosomal protein L37AE/L43A